MNWFRKKNRESGDRDIRKPDIRSFGDQPVHSRSVRGFRALRICAVALVFVSGSLWLAWAVQSTFTQGDWTTATSGATVTLPVAGYAIYDSRDTGITAGTDIRLR